MKWVYGSRKHKFKTVPPVGLTSLCKFKNQLYKKYIDRSSRVDNFTISRNFQLYFFSVFLLFEFEVLEDHNENYWFYQ